MRAGLPPTIQSAGTSRVTTLPAPHNTVVAHSDSRQNCRARTDPYPAADMDRTAGNHHPVVEVMIVGDQLRIGGNLRVIVNGDPSCRHHQAAGHYYHAFANLHLMRSDNSYRCHHTRTLPHRREKLMQEPVIFLGHRHGVVQPESRLCLGGSQCEFLNSLIGAIYPFFFHIFFFLQN